MTSKTMLHNKAADATIDDITRIHARYQEHKIERAEISVHRYS